MVENHVDGNIILKLFLLKVIVTIWMWFSWHHFHSDCDDICHCNRIFVESHGDISLSSSRQALVPSPYWLGCWG